MGQNHISAATELAFIESVTMETHQNKACIWALHRPSRVSRRGRGGRRHQRWRKTPWNPVTQRWIVSWCSLVNSYVVYFTMSVIMWKHYILVNVLTSAVAICEKIVFGYVCRVPSESLIELAYKDNFWGPRKRRRPWKI